MFYRFSVLFFTLVLITTISHAANRIEVKAGELSLDPEWQLVETQVMNWSPQNQVLITFWRSDNNRQTLKCIEHYNKRMEITRSFCE